MQQDIEVNDVSSLIRGMRMLGLTVKEAAKELGISTRTIFRMIKDGRLEASKHDVPYNRGIWLINPLSIAKLEMKGQMKMELRLKKED